MSNTNRLASDNNGRIKVQGIDKSRLYCCTQCDATFYGDSMMRNGTVPTHTNRATFESRNCTGSLQHGTAKYPAKGTV